MLLSHLDKVYNHKEKKWEGKCVAKNCGFPATMDRMRVLVRWIAFMAEHKNCEQYRQCAYIVTLRRIQVTIIGTWKAINITYTGGCL